MIYAFDTYYTATVAKTVCIGFEDWSSPSYCICKSQLSQVQNEYVPGAFYKRELPCILSLLQYFDLQPNDILVVDGFVVLDDNQKMGLGGYLYHQLQQQFAVVGVAKTDFMALQTLKRAVTRGSSKTPLFITALGMDLDVAAEQVRFMTGHFRMPDLLKQLDLLTRME